jgi:hypothetical protein
MSKPIFLMQCAPTSEDNLRDIKKKLQDQLPDWHVLVVASLPPGETAKFEAFSNNARDTEIEKSRNLS